MFFQPVGYFPELGAIRPLRTTAFIALISYILAGEKSERKFFEAKETKAFLGFVIVQIISASFLWLQYGYEMANSWVKTGIIYFLIVMLCNHYKRVEWIFLAIISGIVWLSKYSVTRYFQEHALGNDSWRARGFGWFDGTNDIAMILVAVIPLAFYFIETRPNFLIKGLFASFIGLFSVNLMLTGSRGGLLGFLATSSLCVIGSKTLLKPLKIVVFVLAFALAVPMGINIVKQRSDVVQGSYTQDESAQNRIIQWKAGIQMLIHNPLFGVGPEQFPHFSRDYGGIANLAPHNTVIQVFAESGFPGGILFILMSYFILKDFRFYVRDPVLEETHETELTLYRYLSYSLIGFWVCAFFSNRNQSDILYVTMALIVAVKFLFHENENDEPEQSDYHY